MRDMVRSMRIARVDVYGYDLTYAHGTTSCRAAARSSACPARSCASPPTTGREGFGETCPLGPAYLPAHGGGARAALRELGPALLGLDPRACAVVNDRARHGPARPRLCQERRRRRLLGPRSARRPGCRSASLLGGRRQRRPALHRSAARAGRGDGGLRPGAARRGHPPVPAQARRRPARRRRARSSGARGDGGRGCRDRRRQRRLARCRTRSWPRACSRASTASSSSSRARRSRSASTCGGGRRCRWCSTR